MDQRSVHLAGAAKRESRVVRIRQHRGGLLCLLSIGLVAPDFLAHAREPVGVLPSERRVLQLLPWSTTVNVPF
jgi:hypothetical protein